MQFVAAFPVRGLQLKIAIIGTRGIPANYGGFETFAEECSAGLVTRGHQVTVYCRSHYVPQTLKTYRGVRLIVLPTLKWKYSDTVVHTFFSILHSLFQKATKKAMIPIPVFFFLQARDKKIHLKYLT